MRTSSIRDLHIRTSELVRDAEAGESIIIERRGQPVAELRPITEKPRLSLEDRKRIVEEMRQFWKEHGGPTPGDSTRFISEDRDRG